MEKNVNKKKSFKKNIAQNTYWFCTIYLKRIGQIFGDLAKDSDRRSQTMVASDF